MPSRRTRAAVVVVLSLLLVGMQQEALRHALTHFHTAPTHQELSSPEAGTACVECALLAAGAAALPSAAPVVTGSPGVHIATLPAPLPPAAARPSFYRSRAPPSLS